MAKEIFNRFEIKFQMDTEKYQKLMDRIEPHFITDAYGDEDGFYSVSNLYFDTHDNFFHEQNINREVFRQKLRIRVYGDVELEDNCFVEIKKKYKGVSNKRRTGMRLCDAYRFLEMFDCTGDCDINFSNTLVMKEINHFRNFYSLKPKEVISYDRKALYGKDDLDLRVTFDKNLRKREDDFRLESRGKGDLFMPCDCVMMEVKVSECIPLWFVKVLNEFELVGGKFSKYSTAVTRSDFDNNLVV